MSKNDFIRGMVLGMAAGAAVDMLCCHQRRCRTSVSRAMHRFGDAVDSCVR